MNPGGGLKQALWRIREGHHGLGYIAPRNPHLSRVLGRHEDLRPDLESAAYTDQLRRSAGWEPKHRADDPTDIHLPNQASKSVTA